MPQKRRTLFRAIIVKAKSGRGGKDAYEAWNQFMSPESKQYESIMEQYNAASQEDKNDAKGYLNEYGDEFGDSFYNSRAFAKNAWTDLNDGERDKVAAFIKENLLHPESGE